MEDSRISKSLESLQSKMGLPEEFQPLVDKLVKTEEKEKPERGDSKEVDNNNNGDSTYSKPESSSASTNSDRASGNETHDEDIDTGNESDVELLEIQTYEAQPATKHKKPTKKAIARAAAKSRAVARAAKARAQKKTNAAIKVKLAEEAREQRRKSLNFDNAEILDIDSDDEDEDDNDEDRESKASDLSGAAEDDEDADELVGTSIRPAEKYSPIAIIIQTHNYPYLLAPVSPEKFTDIVSEYDDSIVTLLDEPLMPGSTLSQVFERIKETFKDLENPFNEDDEVIMRFKEFDLSVPETCIHAQEVLLSEIYEAFNSLCTFKGADAPKSLSLELSQQRTFVSKLEEIRKLSESAGQFVDDVLDIGNVELTEINKREEDEKEESKSVEPQPTVLEEVAVEYSQEQIVTEEASTVNVVEELISKQPQSEGEPLENDTKPEEVLVGSRSPITEATVQVTGEDQTAIDITKESSVPTDVLETDLVDNESSGSTEESHAEEFADVLGSTKRPFPDEPVVSSELKDTKRQKEE